MSKLDAALLEVLRFLQKNPQVRRAIPAPRDKTVVYSGAIRRGSDVFHAWRMLEQAKMQDPIRFDYVTLEERLKQFHVVSFGETLFEYTNRVSRGLDARGLGDQAVILWRALSGIYIQGAQGKVRALILPDHRIGSSVFSLTEVNVLLREDVLRNIDIDASLLSQFRQTVRVGLNPAPLVVF